MANVLKEGHTKREGGLLLLAKSHVTGNITSEKLASTFAANTFVLAFSHLARNLSFMCGS
jgi:hypothetical protein